MRRAQELEPLSLIINSLAGRTLYFLLRYDEAIEQLQKTIDMEPNFITAHYYLGKVYVQKGMYQEAIAEFQSGLKLGRTIRSCSARSGIFTPGCRNATR